MTSPDDFLAHYGVKGMHWGVRRDRQTPSVDLKAPKGVTMRRDGSIDISKGAQLQRLVRSNGKSLPMKGLTYASLNDYDNARYIKTIGGKGLFGGGRNQILSIQATKPIKAPSLNESTKITSRLLTSDAEFRKSALSPLGFPISDKELKQIRDDPTGSTARAWNTQINHMMTYDSSVYPGIPHVQQAFKSELQKQGYSALRDENDFQTGVSKAPVIIFDPEKSLKVTSVTDITDELRKANKETLRQYKSAGQSWIDDRLYS